MAGYKRKRNYKKKPYANKKAKSSPRKKAKKSTKKMFKKSSLNNAPYKKGSTFWTGYVTVGSSKKPFLGKLRKALEPNFYVTNSALRLESTPGTQVNSSVMPWLNNTALTAIRDLPSAGALGDRICFDKCVQRLIGTNQSNTNVFVEIYDVVCRRDTTNDPSEAFNQLSSTTENIFAVTPFAAAQFTTLWKVEKITRYNLAGGESFEHLKTIKHFYPVSAGDLVGGTDAPTEFGKITRYSLIMQWSAPYNDQTTQTTATVTLGSSAVDYVWSTQVNYHVLESSTSSVSITNSLPTSFAVNQNIMESGDQDQQIYIDA